MTLRAFDPAFSRDLREELVARSNAQAHAETAGRRPMPHRRQMWTTVVTAVVLLIATVAALQLTRPVAHPAATSHVSTPADQVVDPLTIITDPARTGQFLSRSPRVLLHAIGSDQTTHSRTLTVPSDVTTLRIWLNCSEGAHFTVSLPHRAATGTCAASDATPFDAHVQASTRITVDYDIAEGNDYALLIVAVPSKN